VDEVRKISYNRGDSYRQDPDLAGKKEMVIK
jgi:hypothetical protein